MAALPKINGTVRATFAGAVPGSVWANVWHFRYSGGTSFPGPTEIDALHALAIRIYHGTAFGTGQPWFQNCSNSVTLTTVTYMNLDEISQPYTKTVSGAFGALTGANNMPSNSAYVVTNRTAFRGRSYRGRHYLPCVAETQTDISGYLTAAVQDSMKAQLVGLRTALGGHAQPPVAPFWEMGVASYKLALFTPNQSWTMDGRMDHQDGRK